MSKLLGSFKIIKETAINAEYVEWECSIDASLKNAIKRIFGWKRLTSKRFSWVVTQALEHYLENEESFKLPPGNL